MDGRGGGDAGSGIAMSCLALALHPGPVSPALRISDPSTALDTTFNLSVISCTKLCLELLKSTI